MLSKFGVHMSLGFIVLIWYGLFFLMTSSMFNLKAMSNLLLTVPMSVNLISRLSHFIGVIASVTRRRRDIKIPLCLSAPVWKFNIVSNDHGRTHSF